MIAGHSLLLAALLVACCCHHGNAFYSFGDDVNMDFLGNDTEAKADIDRMMLMNSDDPKLRAEAEEAFHEIMRAKRLTKLQECRRKCVTEHEEAGEFRACNERCEATHKPGEYGELPTLRGEQQTNRPPKPAPQPTQEKAKSEDKEKKEL